MLDIILLVAAVFLGLSAIGVMFENIRNSMPVLSLVIVMLMCVYALFVMADSKRYKVTCEDTKQFQDIPVHTDDGSEIITRTYTTHAMITIRRGLPLTSFSADFFYETFDDKYCNEVSYDDIESVIKDYYHLKELRIDDPDKEALDVEINTESE